MTALNLRMEGTELFGVNNTFSHGFALDSKRTRSLACKVSIIMERGDEEGMKGSMDGW